MTIGWLALAAAAGATGTTRPDYRYVVKRGDTLTDLAVGYLVEGGFREMVRVNRFSDERKLREREIVLIPYRVMRREPVGAQVEAFRGGVTAAGSPVRLGGALSEGMTIATAANSSISIRFADGSRATLPSNSRLRIVRLSRYLLTREVDREFVIDAGETEWQVRPKQPAGDRFRVGTPVATAAVRGTGFRVTFDPDKRNSGSSVIDGEVAFHAGERARTTALPKGYGAVASPTGAIDKRTLLAAPVWSRPFEVQQGEAVSFEIAPMPGARGYKWTIARDAAFADRVTEARTADPKVSFAALADGKYFVRATALDAVALEGFGLEGKFERLLATLTARIVASGTHRAAFAWTGRFLKPPRYRFVLAAEATLANPIVDADGVEGDAFTVTSLKPGRYFWQVSAVSFDRDIERTVATPIESVDIGAP